MGALARRDATSAWDDIPMGVDANGQTVYMPLSRVLLNARKDGFRILPDLPDLPGTADSQEDAR